MPVPPATPQDNQAAIAVVVVLLVACSVVYWRTALRVALALVLILLVYGAVTGMHGVSSMLAHR
jgi:predicted exporter